MRSQTRVRRWVIFLTFSLTAFGLAGTRLGETAFSQRAERNGLPDGPDVQAVTSDASEIRRERARLRKQQAEE